MTTRLPSIERSVWLPADREVVWRHLTEGSLLSTWFGGAAELRARPGGEVRFEEGDGPLRWGTVEAVVPGLRLQWSWRAGDGDPSLVQIELEDHDGGTRLTVTETLLEYEVVDLSPFGRRRQGLPA